MRIQTQLRIAVALGFVLLFVVGSFLYVSARQVLQEIEKNRMADAIARDVFELTLLNNEYLGSPEIRVRIQWDGKQASLTNRLLHADKEFIEEQDHLLLGRIRKNGASIRDNFLRLIAFNKMQESSVVEKVTVDLSSILTGEIFKKSHSMLADAHSLVEGTHQRVLSAQKRADVLIISVMGLFGAMMFGALYWAKRTILDPAADVSRAANSLAQGDLASRTTFQSQSEIGDLARAFNSMATNIQREIHRREQVEQEINLRSSQLEAMNEELNAFAYSVSHDLRQPLRAIDGFSQALQEDYRDRLDEEGKDFLHEIRGGAKRMGRLIDDLLGLSRLTRGDLHRAEVDFSAEALEIAGRLRAEEPERNAEIEIAEGIVADGDPRLLKLVLENLLGNAWKFTKNKACARIEVGVRREDGQPTYFVRDDGAGFDMTYADKLFGAFQRLHSEDEFEGTGIGLATVQRIILRHGGNIWAEGEEGQGATFYFTL